MANNNSMFDGIGKTLNLWLPACRTVGAGVVVTMKTTIEDYRIKKSLKNIVETILGSQTSVVGDTNGKRDVQR